jgi:hypothetical protein
MFSLLRKGLVYRNISSDVVEHDLDIDADQWSYDGRDVYRGAIDLNYIDNALNVYWLYDDDSKRIGLVEHESDNLAEFKCLWFYDNPYATLFQDSEWKSTGKTLMSKLSSEAYQDCLETDFVFIGDQCLTNNVLLITPEILIQKPKIYTCEKCGKKSLMKTNSCSAASVSDLEFNNFSILFVDESFVIYEKSTKDQPLVEHADAQEQELVQAQSVDQEELLVAPNQAEPETPPALEQGELHPPLQP